MILNETDIRNVIFGATILGAGGGGSMSSALDTLNRFIETHPGKDVKVEMIFPSDMEDGAFAAVTAGMGAPKAIIGKDFTPYAVNANDALVKMAAKAGKSLKYTLPVEIGGFNTFVPMLISLLNGIPIVDADGAARAVPALDTLLLHVNGLNTSPLAMADNKNNRLTITLADPRDASEAEIIGRNICVAFDMTAGLAGWMVTKDEIQSAIGNGTISYALKVGQSAQEYIHPWKDNKPPHHDYANIFDHLADYGHLPCKAICTGTITKVETKTAGGFDYGVAIIAGQDGAEYKILFQNENLVLYKENTVLMTAPDIISLYDKKNTVPLTNADTEVGQWVDVGVFKVDERWWKQGEDKINEVWKPYFTNVEYTGKIVRYK